MTTDLSARASALVDMRQSLRLVGAVLPPVTKGSRQSQVDSLVAE